MKVWIVLIDHEIISVERTIKGAEKVINKWIDDYLKDGYNTPDRYDIFRAEYRPSKRGICYLSKYSRYSRGIKIILEEKEVSKSEDESWE